MKNHLGASKGAHSKMKQDKFVIFQYSYSLCFVPIIVNQNVTDNTPLQPLWDDFPLASPP
ncbi:hypothetical protein FMJ60_26795 [Klebsiella quasipneumoniae]|nr:hypothetical protein [Klebsiella quasipneumoniae]MBZ7057433.1 hypothetical protein [Klebsiella quasipneumoniae]